MITEAPFSYETHDELSAEEYVRRETAAFESPRGWRSYLWLSLLTAIGIAALFRWPTFGLGVVLLVGALVGWTSPVWSYRSRLRAFKDQTCLATHHGVEFDSREAKAGIRAGAP